MKTLLRLLLPVAFLAAGLGAAEPLKIHLISGSAEYRSEASLREFSAHLQQLGFVCSASWGQDKGKSLPNLEALPAADLMIVFARRLTLPAEQMKIIRAHWEAGKPVIGIRTASHAWGEKDNPDNAVFDRQVLGNNYAGHYGNEPVAVAAVAAQAAHPVLRGVRPFNSAKLYKTGDLAPTATALQIGTSDQGRQVVTLVNEYRGGRMFYTSLGIPEDFRDENFRRLLLNAIYWTTRREPLAGP